MHNNSDIVARMRIQYGEFTNVEQAIADYFLGNPPAEELSLKQITEKLFVSKASLSRFAKRLGFDGFREFVYQYKLEREALEHAASMPPASMSVFENYLYVINETLQQIDHESIQKAIGVIRSSSRILIYGDGMSGFAANEFMVRFKRLGLQVEAYTTDFLMHINSTTMSSDTLFIGVSLSGNTKNTINNLYKAHESGAKTLLITSNNSLSKKFSFDIILQAAALPQMSTGLIISPQLPILVIIDLLFNNYVKLDPEKNIRRYKETLYALRSN